MSVALLYLVPAFASDISGKWATVIKTAIGEMNYTFDLKAKGEKLTGKAVMPMGKESSESSLTEGSMKGDDISFVETLKVQSQELRCSTRAGFRATRFAVPGRLAAMEPRSSLQNAPSSFEACDRGEPYCPAHVPEIPVEARLAHPLPPADLTI